MNIILAEKAGFCSGVKRAVQVLLEQSAQHGRGYTLGPIVHNEEVIEYLKQYNVEVAGEPEEALGAFLAVRTHGVTPEKFNQLETLENVEIIDLTCPRVKQLHKIAVELKNNDIMTIILGDREHPEVEGLIGWAGSNALVVSSTEEFNQLKIEPPAALIAQTTSCPVLFLKIKEMFQKRIPDGKIYDTLCPETIIRQDEVIKLAQRVEAFIVVGSELSANTRTLLNNCRQIKPSCLAGKAAELDSSFLGKYRVFGVTAGASTPPWTIKEVVERMENENMDEKKEEQFDFDGEIKVAQVGEQLTGKVARVTTEEVYIDIGAKTEAILPVEEVHLDEGNALVDYFSPEDEVEVTVMDIDEQEGKVIVSHKRLARDKRLSELEKYLEDEVILEGKVIQVVPAGIVVDLGSGIEGFMPGSLVDTRYIPDFNDFKDREISFKILEYDREKGKLILSRRKVLEAENAKIREKTLDSLAIGSNITGVVKRLTDFGAFVDVGGIDGLVHISELSWERVNHPSEVLQVGDEIEVKVLEVIPEKERISLSVRKTQPDPWTKTVEDLESGQLVTGKVTRLVSFGAFIEIKPGVEGLAHISQLADYHVKHPSEVLSEGEEVEVKIIEVKPKAKRISLSLKEAGGAMVSPGNYEQANAENGNVTIGDLFGNLFEQENEVSEENKQVAAEVNDDNIEGGQG